MFDHLGIVVADRGRSRAFYAACLSVLGVRLLEDHSESDGSGGWLVFGSAPDAPLFVVASGRPSFWRDPHTAGRSPAHFAFRATSMESVASVHAEGVANGGEDNGAPGRRRGTYAAYLIDPDGNNFDAGFRG